MRGTQARILVADQDRSFSSFLSSGLTQAGFDVSTANCGDAALDLVDEIGPDLMMAERALTGISGIELCRQLKGRSDTQALPIIMMSANADHVDLARALDTGADDFVHKPVTAVEIVARTRAILRRTRPSTVGMRLEYNDIIVEMETLRAYRDGKLLKIGPTEFNLLATFIENPGRVWSRDQLLDIVWGRSTYVDTRTVDVHVGRLRKTLRMAGQGHDPFRTIRGAGYALG